MRPTDASALRRRRRAVRVGAAVAGCAVAGFFGLAFHGGWRPFGERADPWCVVSADGDAWAEVRPEALRADVASRVPAVVDLLAALAEIDATESLTTGIAGELLVVGLRDGGWTLAIPVGGATHAARIGIARLFLRLEGDGPVRELTVAEAGGEPGDTVSCAAAPSLWIVATDEGGCEDALEAVASPVARRAFASPAPESDAPLRVGVADHAAPQVADALRGLLHSWDIGVAEGLPPPDGVCEIVLRAAPGSGVEIVAAWASRGAADVRRAGTADLRAVADRLERGAASRPAEPQLEPSDRVRLTMELSRQGLHGAALREELQRRLAKRGEERGAAARDAEAAALRRWTSILRDLCRAAASSEVANGRVTVRVVLGGDAAESGLR
ncbi:MAG: hypothetical protein K8T90_13585 [Planctomycetes bacterium]|nr:hypothetical protein [Planctomycetota bacterium]